MANKKYWQSFGELNDSETHQQSAQKEFHEELPFEDANDKGLFQAITPRRDFLKYLGFTTVAAAVAASCEVPVRKAIPFANKPEDLVPGVAYYYATTYAQEGEVVSILAKVRDGRPIKIEGNELSPITQGGTSARVQASVLDLYDGARLRFPYADNEESTFEAVDKAVLDALTGKQVVLLTGTITSPSSLEVIKQFLAKYPNSKHVVYDAVSYTGMLLANEATYGKRAIPTYRFDNAKLIVSIGADFLGTWLSPVEFSRQYAKGKKINEKKPEMSKHVHFESVASLTGSNADERYLHRPSQTGLIAVALLNAINGEGVKGIDDEKLKAGIEKTAKELISYKGEALVVAGSNDVNIQVVVNAINEALQSGGKTIDWSATHNTFQAIDKDFVGLLKDMNAGKVDALILQGANPVYAWYDSDKVVSALKKVKALISLNPKADETALLSKYVVPDHHYLESWGDAEAKTGYYSFQQPTINPLFKTRQWQDSLLKWSGATADYHTFFKSYWSNKVGGETGLNKALQEGVFNPSPQTLTAALFNSSAVRGAVLAASVARGGKIELQLYQKITIGAGQGAANPWLQETPDPVTKATWDNYLVVSPSLAKTLLGIDITNNSQADAYEVQPPKHVVEIKANGKTIQLPALIIPGTHPETVGIALGYGRTARLGRAVVTEEGTPVGVNVFPFASLNGDSISYNIADVELKDTGDKYKVALTQTHSLYDTPQGKRTEVMKELTLTGFKENPTEVLDDRAKELKPFGGLDNFREEGSIYKPFDKPGIKWGMSVDLNTCTGCAACVVSCIAENNIPVVGKPEVLRFHDMHWIRIDRYYSGNADNPQVVFQPMMCQHCDNAPCENVCPVAATNHSSEGLNQMTYNRCIGTRYCANNCPYKVRRFNWADYTGADSFPDNQKEVLNDVVMMMNDDLPRMVLNPDVTVRSRGVIEKCSFCVQRLQEGKLKAKKESRPLKSGENNEWDLKTACQQACPTDAIVFGNVNDEHSAITLARADNPNRLFYSLEQLHVLPNVNYLAKIRNRKEEEKAERLKSESSKA